MADANVKVSILSQIELNALSTLNELLNMMDPCDYHLIHNTVRSHVESGKYGKQFEATYMKMVEDKLKEQGIKS